MKRRILFAPFGSEGDTNPLFWLAEGLARRGYEPVFLLSPHYGRRAEARGFVWHAVGTEEDFLRFARNPNLWHAMKGPSTVIEGMVRSFDSYRAAFAQAGPGCDLVVTSSFALPVAALAEAAGLPRLTLHLQPICLRSVHDPPLFLPELAWLDVMPRWVRKVFFTCTDLAIWRMVARPLNDFRKELGLPPLRRFYEEAVHGAEGVAALFPDWFAPPQPDWPRQVRQFGFPVPRPPSALDPGLEAFLAAGDPPVIWTHGSANFFVKDFQARAVAVSRQIGRRCLLVSLENPSAGLPDFAFHCPHVPFEDVFPRCAAAVHHGGIGTTAKCIAAGIPQFIIPRSHDQPDNARRIERLGLGTSLLYRRMSSPALPHALQNLLESPSVAAQCRDFQSRLRTHDPLGAVCAWAESLARSSRVSS